MALNLLLSHSPDEIRELLSYSYATFQNMDQPKGLEDRREDLLSKLMQKMEGCGCESHDDIIQLVQKRKEGYQLLGKMEKRRRTFVEESFKEQHLYRGKLFQDNNGKLYCALGIVTDRGETVCECLKLKGLHQVAPREY